MSKAKVIIAGAGPGDPGLITLKAARYLRQADVIIADRLVSEELLREHAHPAAEIIYTGKEGRASASVPQKSINALMVVHALAGKLVVRLKGGDVAFFSNVLDELTALREQGIPYEIIPGITAASGASAYCGIPLTARGYTEGVRMLTYFNKEHKPDTYWAELAATDDTLVFYMSGEHLNALAGNLARHPVSEDKQVALIAQATTPYQQVQVFRLRDIVDGTATLPAFVSPTLIIIGKVTALHERFGWKGNRSVAGHYFRPAAGIVRKRPKTVDVLTER